MESHCRRIWMQPSCFFPEVVMEFDIPNDMDDEEYIDEFLDSILDEEFRYNVDWDFL